MLGTNTRKDGGAYAVVETWELRVNFRISTMVSLGLLAGGKKIWSLTA